MPPGNESGSAGRRHATRAAGVLPLVAAITSALALTGAAFYTVDRATCGDPGQYVRHDNHIELVGGCVDDADLSGLRPEPAPQEASSGDLKGNNYRP